jgi:5'-3' exonuclease
MGIKGLSKFLQTKMQPYGVPFVPPPDPQRVAIDVPLFLHKFYYIHGTAGLPYCFTTMRTNLVEANLKPIWVFDGNKLQAKGAEVQRRIDARGTPDHTIEGRSSPGKQDYALVRETLKDDDVRIAQYEAEALCAYLVHTEQAWAAMTDDTDSFAYLCPRTIVKASMNVRSALVVDLASILSATNLTPDQFQQFCVACGCDFGPNVAGIGPVTAYKKTVEGSVGFDASVKKIFESFCYEQTCSAPERVKTTEDTMEETV